MISRDILTLLLLLFFSLNLSAQHLNIMISNTNYPEEPTISIDPFNTERLVAGANIDNYYYSNNGGYNWEKGVLTSAPYGVWGDPVTLVDNEGNYYFFHLSNPPSGSWIDRIVCQKSTNGGQTWNEGTYMGLNGTKAQDKEWAAIDRRNGNIYVTWTQFDDYGSSNPDDRSNIMFSRSFDSGETWSPAMRINEIDGDCIDSDNTVEGAVPAVGPMGEIFVAWAGPVGLVFDKSTDQGETWLEEDVFITDIPGGWDYDIPGISRCNGLPITTVDTSGGAYHGTIYVNWSDQRNGSDDTDVWLVKSTDAGETWSDPVRVNDDPPGKQQFFTWMTVDQVTGHLHFVFYDRRNYPDNNTDVYMAVSKDGGETFQNYKVSEEPFVPTSGVFFGDYNNVTAHNDVIRPIWTRLHNGNLSVWTAIVNSFSTGLPEASRDNLPFTLQQNFPNPFTETTHFAFKLKETSLISLKVVDMMGRNVATIINRQKRNPGVYFEHFQASQHHMKPGVYYFSLTGNNVNQVRKMIIE